MEDFLNFELSRIEFSFLITYLERFLDCENMKIKFLKINV